MSIFFWSKCLKLWFFIFINFKNLLIRPPCYYKQYYFTSTRRTKGSNTYPLNIVFPSLPIVRIAEHFAVESEIEIQNKDHFGGWFECKRTQLTSGPQSGIQLTKQTNHEKSVLSCNQLLSFALYSNLIQELKELVNMTKWSTINMHNPAILTK